MTDREESCIHDKVFADYCLASDPPIYPWICRKCGKHGMETGVKYTNDYDDVVKFWEQKEVSL